MDLGEKIKNKREISGITQIELANKLGITTRALSNYETGKRIPTSENIIKLAEVFQTTTDYFLISSDNFIVKAHDKYGSKGSNKVQKLITEVNTLFAGGELSDCDKDLLLQSMTNIYFESKERAKQKYTPKKYQNNDKK